MCVRLVCACWGVGVLYVHVVYVTLACVFICVVCVYVFVHGVCFCAYDAMTVENQFITLIQNFN